MLRWAPLLFPLLAFPAAHAQDPVIRIDVNLVQVDAVVTDSHNQHVANLKAADFEILQDGKPQAITNFSYVAPAASPALTAAHLAKDAVTLPEPPPLSRVQPTAANVRRMFALVVDDLGLSAESMPKVRDALRKFVNQQMQAGDVVAILRTSAGMGALQQFTSDPRLLNAAIDHVKFTFGRLGIASFAPAIAPSPNDKFTAIDLALDQVRNGVLMSGTLGALRYVIEGLHDMPGRKTVVVFSESLTLQPGQDLRDLTDAANRSSVVIDTIDPRGLQTFVDLRDTDGSPKVRAQREADTVASQQGMLALAGATGGRFIKDNNRVDEALQEAVDDSQGYYLLGYRPDPATFDKGGQSLYHRVEVRVTVPSLHVRSRNGFFGESDAAYAAPLTGGAALLHALTSPFASGDLRVQLTTLFNQTAGKHSNLTALLHVDADALTFTPQPDGSRKASFEVATMTFGLSGKPVDRGDRIFNVDLTPSQYAAALSQGLVYVMNQPVRTPGVYQFRVALRDQGSQRIGAANQFIDVPDLTNGRLTLSSVLLRPNQADGKPAADDPAAVAAHRVFVPGQPLYYEYFVFNAQAGANRKADLEVQTRLFREGAVVYTGQPMVPALAGDASAHRLLAGGHLTLADALPPGDYVLQIIVTDKAAKQKYRSATQAIDFEVLSRTHL